MEIANKTSGSSFRMVITSVAAQLCITSEGLEGDVHKYTGCYDTCTVQIKLLLYDKNVRSSKLADLPR